MIEYKIYKQEIKRRLSLMENVAGGEFSNRELKIISIVWNRHNEILQEIQNEMTSIEDIDNELEHYFYPSEDTGAEHFDYD